MIKALQKIFGFSTCKDCVRVHDLIHVIIDDEATDDEKKFFKEHVDKCQPCLEKHQVEKSLINSIKAKIGHKCCPEKVLDSIKEKIKNTPS